MKAIIMAGGFGTRLRPLTCQMPKPMVPMVNRPMMEHIIMLLKEHQITEMVALLFHQAESISDYFGDGSKFGVKIDYLRPDADYGTAGVDGRQLLDVRREGMPPIDVLVELRGATELVLEVSDGGDGISCDQADWADAQAELEDGRKVWISDLPMVLRHRGPQGTLPPFSFSVGGMPSADLLASREPERSWGVDGIADRPHARVEAPVAARGAMRGRAVHGLPGH